MPVSCPDDPQPLEPRSPAGLTCRRCSGAWLSEAELGTLGAGVNAALLAPELRENAAAFRTTRRCPECETVLAPWRIATLEAWSFRCPSCGQHWLDAGAQRTLALAGRRRAMEQAYQSMAPEERRELAQGLAQASAGDGYPLSPLHELLAGFGLPVIRRTEGSRTPLATWGLALALVAIYALGGPGLVERWGYQPQLPTVASAFAACLVHFSVWHLLGNLYFLLAFGDGVEQKVSRGGVGALFLLLGAASLALDGWAQPEATVIAGASGGIAALMGACVILQPRAQVAMRLGTMVARIPIWGYGLLELAYQTLMAMLGVPGTAWVAHLGGLILGAVAGALLRATGLTLATQPA